MTTALYFDHHTACSTGKLHHFWQVMQLKKAKVIARIEELTSGQCVLTLKSRRVIECADIFADFAKRVLKGA